MKPFMAIEAFSFVEKTEEDLKIVDYAVTKIDRDPKRNRVEIQILFN